jgi:hypothetical protein
MFALGACGCIVLSSDKGEGKWNTTQNFPKADLFDFRPYLG